MFTHADIWRAIDRLAEAKGLSPSGLAKKAGLDPTTFNKSKRHSPGGNPRWPSTESLAKILAATGATITDLMALTGEDEGHEDVSENQNYALVNLKIGTHIALAYKAEGQEEHKTIKGFLVSAIGSTLTIRSDKDENYKE